MYKGLDLDKILETGLRWGLFWVLFTRGSGYMFNVCAMTGSIVSVDLRIGVAVNACVEPH